MPFCPFERNKTVIMAASQSTLMYFLHSVSFTFRIALAGTILGSPWVNLIPVFSYIQFPSPFVHPTVILNLIFA